MKLNKKRLRKMILQEMADFDMGSIMAKDPNYDQGYHDNMSGMELPASGDPDYLAGWLAAHQEKEDELYNRQEDRRRTDQLTRQIRRKRGHRHIK